MATVNFNAEDVLIFAQNIERLSAGYYRAAAKMAGDEQVKKMFEFLADQEEKHEHHYSDLRDLLRQNKPSKQQYAQQDEAVVLDFLATYLDEEVMSYSKQRIKTALASGKVDSVLYLALELEKDTISFYSAFKETLESDQDKSMVHKIIMDEFGHVNYLTRTLQELKQRTL